MPSPLLFLLISLLLLAPCRAQQTTPFLGQGVPPRGNGTDIYVTSALTRLLEVDDRQYRFELAMFMLLSWTDSRAADAIAAATATANASNPCAFYCSSLRRSGELCCAGDLWLPDLEFMNVIGFPEERVVRYGIAVNDTAVSWWTTVQGTFFATMSFKAFPFDTQKLLIQVAYAGNPGDPPVRFIPSATSLRTFQPRAGDDISGWKVDNLTVIPYTINPDAVLSITTTSAPGDVWPIHPAPNDPNPRFIAQLWRQGFMIVITVNRISSFYVYITVLPLILSTVLAFLNFFLPPTAIAERIATLVTLFLALVALAIVVSEYLPHTSEILPTQQLTTINYVILAVGAVEAIIVYKIATQRKQMAKRKSIDAAKDDFEERWQAAKAAKAAKRGTDASQSKRAGCLRWRGRRAQDTPGEKVESAEENGGGTVEVEMAVPLADPAPPNPVNYGNGPPAASISSGSIDTEEERSNGTDAAPASLSSHKLRIGAAMAEAKRNPDYAEYVAKVVDRTCFWTLLLLYTIAVILILTLNSTYQPPVTI